MTAQDQCCVATATLALQVHGSTCVYGDALLASFFLPPASLVNMQPSGTEQFLKDLMEQREQKKIEKGGEKAGVGKFRHAALDENKSLHMKATTTGMPPSSPPPSPQFFPYYILYLQALLLRISRRRKPVSRRNQENRDTLHNQWTGIYKN